MKFQYINHHSERLVVFFAGWGCDEHQFAELKDPGSDILILFDYDDLKIPFDFSKYAELNVIAYSAGVFVSSLLNAGLPRVKKRVAVNGNPYLFDEDLGLSKRILNVLESVDLNNYLAFRRQYMVETDAEFSEYNRLQSLRSVESCAGELNFLKELYALRKPDIRDDFDKAVFSENEPFFNLDNQKKFYDGRIKIVAAARHHLFFKFKSFEEILNY